MSKQVSLDELRGEQRTTRGKEIGWERWCDGEGHLLSRGDDFTSDRYSARSAFLQWAKRYGFQDETQPKGSQGPPTETFGTDSFWLQVPAESHHLSDARIACARELQRLHKRKAPIADVLRIRRAFRNDQHPADLPPIPAPKVKEPKPTPENPAFDPVEQRQERIAHEVASGVQPRKAVYTRRSKRL